MIILKLDFHKAFDTVNWECLLHVLQQRGFGNRWTTWIRNILSTSKAHILINGIVGEEIQYKRGVRQGDPLSPYLFILVADVLQRLIRHAATNGVISHPLDIQGFSSVLQYADDTLILLKGEVQQILVLKELLDTFSCFSGLRINYHKSTLIPIHMSTEDANAAATALHCPISSLPCNYLGLPLAANRIHHSLLQPIIDKVDRKLA